MGFFRRLVRYVACGGHYFYIRVRVPDGKDPRAVAEKLLDCYDIRKKALAAKTSASERNRLYPPAAVSRS